MKKINVSIILVVILLLLPVNITASEKKIITHEEFLGYKDYYSDCDKYYSMIEAMDGCYQENGLKIYTVLNGKTKKLNRTGQYAIVVGGKTEEKDMGYVKFVAPKTGTYEFTFDVNENVARDRMTIIQKSPHSWVKEMKLSEHTYYEVTGEEENTYDPMYDYRILLTPTNKPATEWRGYMIYYSGNTVCTPALSYMDKISGTMKLKKGEYVLFQCSYCDYGSGRYEAYNFAGFDLTISKK